MYITIINDIIQNVFLTGHIKNRYPHYGDIYTFFFRVRLFFQLFLQIFSYIITTYEYIYARIMMSLVTRL